MHDRPSLRLYGCLLLPFCGGLASILSLPLPAQEPQAAIASTAPHPTSEVSEATAHSKGDKQENVAHTVAEARGRARILHEALHGALQVMHRDFFREDEGLSIPSRSLEDVFKELARTYSVQLKWLAVDLAAMNQDNQAKTDFEKAAVRMLQSGKPEFESVTADEYRFAGRIRLSATCLSCHASRRSSNDERSAGLVIIMPLKREAAGNP